MGRALSGTSLWVSDDGELMVVRAVVVLRDGFAGTPELARELPERSPRPYRYPRIVEFADELPRTTSGKVQRALLRAGG